MIDQPLVSKHEDVTNDCATSERSGSMESSTLIDNAGNSRAAEIFDRRSLRLYSKKHRVYVFREFIIQKYHSYLHKDDVILDIAGGKGDLSWVLTNVDQFQSIVIDPRRTINHIDKSVSYLRQHPDECLKRSIPNQSSYQPLAALMPILERNNYLMNSPPHIRIFADQELVSVLRNVTNNQNNCTEEWEQYWTRATQRTVHFITPSGKNDFSIERVNESDNNVYDAKSALQYILNAKLIVGYHPDQATDACFALASILRIPVCAVPCCVFPSEFKNRRLQLSCGNFDAATNGNSNNRLDSDDTKAVETYDELIQYIKQQYNNLNTETLHFPGTTTARRIVLYTLPLPQGQIDIQ